MQHTFYLDRGQVRVSVTHGGKQYRRSTGLKIRNSKLWDAITVLLKSDSGTKRILTDLLTIHSRLEERESNVRSQEGVHDAMTYALDVDRHGKNKQEYRERTDFKKRPTFWEYFDEWSKRPSTSKRQRALAARIVAKFMGRNENWEDIDSAYWFRLQQKMEDAGFSVNYRWNVGSRLKVVMHEGFKLKYHHNDEFREFRAKSEASEAIALSPEEIELLWKYQPRNEMYGKIRDVALIGYYSAARFSDYSRLSLDNVHDGRLEFVQKKTGDKVIIPASPSLVLLMERNGGAAPHVNQAAFNRCIKRIAHDCGIGGIVALPKNRQKKDGTPTYRWEMVQSHTFRRSAITALYLSGTPVRDCMFVSGHKSIGAFERYLRIGKELAVERLSQSDFFK